MNFTSNVSQGLTFRESSSIAVAKNVIVLALSITISYINGTLIHTFRKHQIFYVNPRYILFIHLVVNDIIQLTLGTCLFVFSYVFYKINASFCFVIITLAIFTTLNTPLNLAVMAMECYIAICFPLHHADFCTLKRTYILISCIWAMSAISILPDVFLVIATEPVQYLYSTVFCERDALFRHPISLQMRDISYTTYLIGVWLTLLYTYFRIFFAAKAAKEAKSADRAAKKARNTILLHGFQLLLCILTYVAHLLIKALLSWFPNYYADVGFFVHITVQVLPRFLSPIVYGLRDKTFREHLKKYLLFTIRLNHGGGSI